jgi:hypothetical protein
MANEKGEFDWNDRRFTKLCESCRGSGTRGPRYPGELDEYDVPFAAGPGPECNTCNGRGRVLLGS